MPGGWHARCVARGMVAAPLELIDDLNLDGIFRAGVDAGRFEAVCEAPVAHVALAYNAALGIELRDRVRAVPYTILAADAGLRRMKNDAGSRIFRVGVDRAALECSRRLRQWLQPMER